MLQKPEWVKENAMGGESSPTYAYALNNPIKNTDPTGLYSWRLECEGAGIVFSYTTVFGDASSPDPQLILRGTGAVGLDTGSDDACYDFEKAIELQKQYGNDPAMVASRSCWNALKREIASKRQGIQKRKPEPIPPPGYCAQ